MFNDKLKKTYLLRGFFITAFLIIEKIFNSEVHTEGVKTTKYLEIKETLVYDWFLNGFFFKLYLITQKASQLRDRIIKETIHTLRLSSDTPSCYRRFVSVI